MNIKKSYAGCDICGESEGIAHRRCCFEATTNGPATILQHDTVDVCAYSTSEGIQFRIYTSFEFACNLKTFKISLLN